MQTRGMKCLLGLLAPIVLTISLSACDDPESSSTTPPGELITYVKVQLIDSANTADTVYATFSDTDGPSGSRQPIISGATIGHGRTYIGSIELFELTSYNDDSLTNITGEISELGTQHQFFYTVSGDNPGAISVEITDKDANNLPLGLSFKLRTQPGSGMIHDILNVVLSHYEQAASKNGEDRSDDSDIDIDFPFMVQ